MWKSAGLRTSSLVIAVMIGVGVLGYCAADEGIPGQGSLSAVIRQEGAEKHLEFPLEHTDVRASIAGLVADVEVVQHFSNPYEQKIEAVYVFPLPENAAVNDMLMKIGDRTIRGEIKKREEAKQIYDEAKEAGHMAALLEQERPNIFTQSVANIEPGNKILVTIRYVQDLKYDHGSYKFVFPMVVGPRYIPGQPTGKQAGGWAPDTDKVPDASRITPPVLKPDERSGHDIRVSVRLDAGVAIQALRSKSHEVDIRREGQTSARVILLPKDRIPNKDFVLEYDVAGESPQMALLTNRSGDSGYFTLMIQDLLDADLRLRAEFADDEITAKEMIFVVDNSGSMRGAPIEKCKAAMRQCLKNMNPNDSFQVIRFSETASALATKPLPNSPENVNRGLKYVGDMKGMGGTKMIEGIKASLSFAPDPERMRIVCFMTDGYIGNETEILAAIEELLGDARLFSFGVGSSVNRYLLDRMAETGRGTVQYVRPDEDTTAAVTRFYERIDKPFLLDIEMDWAGLKVADIYPRRIPDLFSAQPVIIHGRYEQPGSATITLNGTVAGKPYSQKLPVELPDVQEDNAALASLWARTRIADLMAQMYREEVKEIVEEVTRIGLEFRLMTKYTSFVAVEEKIITEGGQPKTIQVPVPMPEYVSYEGVFGKEELYYLSARPAGPRGAAGATLAAPVATLGDSVSTVAEARIVPRQPIADPLKYLQDRNLVSGTGQPIEFDKPITRYEVAAILERALWRYSLATPALAGMPFSDVPDGHWAWTAVVNMAHNKLMSGRVDGTFAGAEPLTRHQFAEIMANLLKLAGIKPMWGSIGGIQMMLDYALWDKVADHNYRPDDAITRAEAYHTIARAASLIEHK